MPDHRYLIIGGSTKCGTTSLFHYLEFHPGVCACAMKESRYFWNGDYLPGVKRSGFAGSGTFESLFPNCKPGSVRLEATPDYLYSADSAERIHSALPQCRMIFLLRDPADRLESWYRFSLQNGFIPAQTSFAAYAAMQVDTPDQDTPQHLRAMEQGRYASYLEPWYRLFGADSIRVLYYEHMVADPKSLCRDVAAFASLDPGYFDQFSFKVYNPSGAVKSVQAHQLFRKLKRTLRPVTRVLPQSLRKPVKQAGYQTEQWFRSANTRSGYSHPINLSPEKRKSLDNYYSGDIRKLHQLTGALPPWTTATHS